MTENTSIQTLQDQIRQSLEIAKKTFEAPSFPRIQTKNKRFTLPDGTSSVDPISVVILDYRNLRTYYEGIYNENNPKPPVCFAQSLTVEDLAPDERSPKPQAELCSLCSMNEFGSDPSGRGGKACHNNVLLAVTSADPSKTDIYGVKVSPTALRSWNAMLSRITKAGELPVQRIVELSFNPAKDYPTLVFQEIGINPHLEHSWKLREQAQAYLEQHSGT